MDKIIIKDIKVYAKHGLLPEEKIYEQLFIITAAFYLDLRKAGMSGDLVKTIDYGEACQAIAAFVTNNSFDLIETLAERLAEKLLIENHSLQKIRLKVEKPNAQIPVSFKTVYVEIERSRHTVYIALGSNMGDKEGNLRAAVNALDDTRGCKVLRTSGFILTKPYGYADQDDFLNACLELETLMTPDELLDLLHDIENRAGRERDIRWGPRTLDLDIILYDDIITSGEALKIPHNDMHRRDFVLVPLNEIAPNVLHPVYKKTAAELLCELKAENNTHRSDGLRGGI